MRAVRVAVAVVLLPTFLAVGQASSVAAPRAETRACEVQFSDVSCTHPLHGEIAWLVGEGLANGYADGTFRPGVTLSRQAVAAMLFRGAGSPVGPFPDPGFSDVPLSHPFFDEIAWMVDEGLAAGYADGT